MDQQLFGFHQPTVNQIIITGNVHDLFKKPDKMKLAEACNAGNIVKLDIFRAMLVDIIAYVEKEVDVLQMFLVF